MQNRRKQPTADPRAEMLAGLSAQFRVTKQRWLPSGGATTLDGRDLLFRDTHDPDGQLRRQLDDIRRLGSSSFRLMVYEPFERDQQRMAALPAPLRGGYTIFAYSQGIVVFQLVAFDASDREICEEQPALPRGRVYAIWREALSAWDGTPLNGTYTPVGANAKKHNFSSRPADEATVDNINSALPLFPSIF